MNAKPYPGPQAVGGATPHPREALAVENRRGLARQWSAAHPVDAAVAALAWHGNQAIIHHVSVSYTLAELARNQGQAVVDAGERHLPEGPLRAACVTAGRLQVHFAEVVAHWAVGFGRRFGHLAFAFPRLDTPPAAPLR
jgi:hypothetical protein